MSGNTEAPGEKTILKAKSELKLDGPEARGSITYTEKDTDTETYLGSFSAFGKSNGLLPTTFEDLQGTFDLSGTPQEHDHVQITMERVGTSVPATISVKITIQNLDDNHTVALFVGEGKVNNWVGDWSSEEGPPSDFSRGHKYDPDSAEMTFDGKQAWGSITYTDKEGKSSYLGSFYAYGDPGYSIIRPIIFEGLQGTLKLPGQPKKDDRVQIKLERTNSPTIITVIVTILNRDDKLVARFVGGGTVESWSGDWSSQGASNGFSPNDDYKPGGPIHEDGLEGEEVGTIQEIVDYRDALVKGDAKLVLDIGSGSATVTIISSSTSFRMEFTVFSNKFSSTSTSDTRKVFKPEGTLTRYGQFSTGELQTRLSVVGGASGSNSLSARNVLVFVQWDGGMVFFQGRDKIKWGEWYGDGKISWGGLSA